MRKTAFVIFMLLLLVQPVWAGTRLFDIKHRRAADVAATLQEALGSAARVVPIRDSLMVSASATDLALAADLIARLDRPARMLRV